MYCLLIDFVQANNFPPQRSFRISHIFCLKNGIFKVFLEIETKNIYFSGNRVRQNLLCE